MSAPSSTSGSPAEAPAPQRRRFLAGLSRAAMAIGLVGGYGSFAAIAARYLYPARPPERRRQFVTDTRRFPAGGTIVFTSPAGETINITRHGSQETADDFVALSSICPHLGCQVHWESQNARYFCPCHNGTFDASGTATGGPPFEAGQHLPRYPLHVDRGRLFVEVATSRLVIDHHDRPHSHA